MPFSCSSGVSALELPQAGLSLGTVPRGQQSCRSQRLRKAAAPGTPAPRPDTNLGVTVEGPISSRSFRPFLLAVEITLASACPPRARAAGTGCPATSGRVASEGARGSGGVCWGQIQSRLTSEIVPVRFKRGQEQSRGARRTQRHGRSDSKRCWGQHGDTRRHAWWHFPPSQAVAGDLLPKRVVGQRGGLPKHHVCGHSDPRSSLHHGPKALLFCESSCRARSAPKRGETQVPPASVRTSEQIFASSAWAKLKSLLIQRKGSTRAILGEAEAVPSAKPPPAAVRRFVPWQKWSWKVDLGTPEDLWSSSASMLVAEPGVEP